MLDDKEGMAKLQALAKEWSRAILVAPKLAY